MSEKMDMDLNKDEGLREFLNTPQGEKLIKEIESAANFTEKEHGYDNTKVRAYYILSALCKKSYVFEAFNYIYGYGFKEGYKVAKKELKEGKKSLKDRPISHFDHVLLDTDNLF